MSEAPGETAWTIGDRHLATVQPPDIVRFAMIGDISAGDVKAVFDTLNEIAPSLAKPVFILADLARMGSVTPEARKVAGSQAMLPPCVMIFIGATRLQRTLIQLVDRGYRLLTRDPDPAPAVFVRSEDEAQRWVEEHRRAQARAVR